MSTNETAGESFNYAITRKQSFSPSAYVSRKFPLSHAIENWRKSRTPFSCSVKVPCMFAQRDNCRILQDATKPEPVDESNYADDLNALVNKTDDRLRSVNETYRQYSHIERQFRQLSILLFDRRRRSCNGSHVDCMDCRTGNIPHGSFHHNYKI